VAVAAGTAGIVWYSLRKPAPPPAPSEGLAFEFGVYFLPTATSDPSAAVATAALEQPGFALAEGEPTADGGSLRVFVSRVDDVAESYAPPDAGAIDHFGRGLSDAQREALGRSREALRLRFQVPRARALEGLRAACQLASEVARRTGGLVWDEETREVFAPAAWDAQRLEPWPAGTVPDLSRHITIHSYRDEAYLRAITLGMAKFGLPDLVVEDFALSNNLHVGHLINLTAQALAEGGAADANGELVLRIADIRHEAVRSAQQSSLKPNAEGVVTLRLRSAARDDGDPDNELVEIGFDRYPGPDLRARQDELLASLFGWEDSITNVEQDEELLAASRGAREKLPALKAIVDAGLQPGQLLMVKAPFAKPDGGNEWMWVEVVRWRSGRIHGVLANEPFEVPELRAGQEVVVAEDDVFDYLLRNPDGSEQGNETGRLIVERQKPAEAR
jgi:uncharacterized protein YegJ (DUF2314 family)